MELNSIVYKNRKGSWIPQLESEEHFFIARQQTRVLYFLSNENEPCLFYKDDSVEQLTNNYFDLSLNQICQTFIKQISDYGPNEFLLGDFYLKEKGEFLECIYTDGVFCGPLTLSLPSIIREIPSPLFNLSIAKRIVPDAIKKVHDLNYWRIQNKIYKKTSLLKNPIVEDPFLFKIVEKNKKGYLAKTHPYQNQIETRNSIVKIKDKNPSLGDLYNKTNSRYTKKHSNHNTEFSKYRATGLQKNSNILIKVKEQYELLRVEYSKAITNKARIKDIDMRMLVKPHIISKEKTDEIKKLREELEKSIVSLSETGNAIQELERKMTSVSENKDYLSLIENEEYFRKKEEYEIRVKELGNIYASSPLELIPIKILFTNKLIDIAKDYYFKQKNSDITKFKEIFGTYMKISARKGKPDVEFLFNDQILTFKQIENFFNYTLNHMDLPKYSQKQLKDFLSIHTYICNDKDGMFFEFKLFIKEKEKKYIMKRTLIKDELESYMYKKIMELRDLYKAHKKSFDSFIKEVMNLERLVRMIEAIVFDQFFFQSLTSLNKKVEDILNSKLWMFFIDKDKEEINIPKNLTELHKKNPPLGLYNKYHTFMENASLPWRERWEFFSNAWADYCISNAEKFMIQRNKYLKNCMFLEKKDTNQQKLFSTDQDILKIIKNNIIKDGMYCDSDHLINFWYQKMKNDLPGLAFSIIDDQKENVGKDGIE